MDIPRNAFKRALADGRRQIGIWSSLGSNIVAEILAPAGFDWVLLDMEHSPNEIPGLIQQMQALSGGTATPEQGQFVNALQTYFGVYGAPFSTKGGR